MYIYERKNWPEFIWDKEKLSALLSEMRYLQGRIIGKMESVGFDLKRTAVLDTLTLDIMKSSEIEGEILNNEQVRSSIARRLGMDIPGMVVPDRNVDGVVDMMLDATRNFSQPLTADRLFSWHSALFPEGRSGMYKISTGKWRTDSTGPMQIVSGPIGREKVHYQAMPASIIDSQIKLFLDWVNNGNKIDGIIKAGIAHLWFVTIHPFEDGNGRIGRAIADMMLSRADGIADRFYSMSAQIRIERKYYYEILEKTQKGDLDITLWLEWFLTCLKNSLMSSELILSKVLQKHKFWNEYAKEALNTRQIVMLNKLLDGFAGKLTTSKWALITKCSSDTALRDIQDLINRKILKKDSGGGRSTGYELADIVG